jgi:hypothetical protein
MEAKQPYTIITSTAQRELLEDLKWFPPGLEQVRLFRSLKDAEGSIDTPYQPSTPKDVKAPVAPKSKQKQSLDQE